VPATHLYEFRISGVSSLVRDLSQITKDWRAAEAALSSGALPLDPMLLKPLKVRHHTGELLRSGDLVLFSPTTVGAYDSIDVAGERLIPLCIGDVYVGVLCERRSGKFFCAAFTEPPRLDGSLDLQFMTASGGIGYVTGFSRTMALDRGCGRAGDVEILGAIIDPSTNRPVNTVEHLMRSELAGDYLQRTPLVLVCGSGADVGKTTVTTRLINALSAENLCTGVKATGTGRQFDSAKHRQGGAAYIVNQTDVGLPTTYVDEHLFMSGMRQLFWHASDPNTLIDQLRAPTQRGRELPLPDVVVVELGGDLGESGIPALLDNSRLMHSLAGVVVCAESVLALTGCLSDLRRSRISTDNVPIFAAMPWGNVEGVLERFGQFVRSGEISAIFDCDKPEGLSEREMRLGYARSHAGIRSVAEVARLLQAQWRPMDAGVAAAAA
jgi:hypothetical protein